MDNHLIVIKTVCAGEMQGEICFVTTPEGLIARNDRLMILASKQQVANTVIKFVQAYGIPQNIFLARDLDHVAGKEL